MSENRRRSERVRKMILAGLFVALGILLPFLVAGNVPAVMRALSPMHIPVFLCGFICGWQYGLLVGIVTPLLRSVLVGIPVMYPGALAMAFELGVYGLVSGFIFSIAPKKDIRNVYLALIVAMICGRLVWGAVRLVMLGVVGTEFTWGIFLSSAVTGALPAIVLHLLVVPALVMAYMRIVNR